MCARMHNVACTLEHEQHSRHVELSCYDLRKLTIYFTCMCTLPLPVIRAWAEALAGPAGEISQGKTRVTHEPCMCVCVC